MLRRDPVTVTKLGISVVVGLFAAAAAFFFTQQGILKVRDSDILYVKKGPIAPGIVRLSRTPGQGFSFFINVYITPKQGQRGSFTVLADRFNKLSFLIRSDGIPEIRWESKKRLPSPKVHQGLPGNRKVTWDRWNHVGFVYEGGKLATFVNGRKCRETSIGNETFTLSNLELLPGTTDAGTKKESLKVKATYPVLLARALSLQHILELGNSSRLYDHLGMKIFFLFLFGFLVSFFAITQLFLPFISPGNPGFTVVYQVRRNVLFVFSIHFIFFLVFNLGYSAARHINLYFGNRRLWNPSAYFTFLAVIGFVFLFSLALGKITGTPYRICFLYGCGVMSLLMFTVILCLLPRFDDIYPFIFNGLFSLFFSLIIAAPDILRVLHIVTVEDETGEKSRIGSKPIQP